MVPFAEVFEESNIASQQVRLMYDIVATQL
jgi:hypothetical protein